MQPTPNSSIFPEKPQCNYGEVVATDRGWEVKQPGGYMEILVSRPNLKADMDSMSGLSFIELAPAQTHTPAPAFAEGEVAQVASPPAAVAPVTTEGVVDAMAAPGGVAPAPAPTAPMHVPEGMAPIVALEQSGPETGSDTGEGGESGENGTSGSENGTSAPEGDALYTFEGLDALKMDALRPIGAKFDVRDTSKAQLIEKILAAQASKQ